MPNALEARLESGAAPLELVVDGRIAEATQHRRSRRGGKRVAGERAGLVDVADRREALHQLGAPAKGRGRKAAADDLAEDRQVGRDAVALLGPTPRDAEAGDHLVEDEQRAARVAQHPQRLEESRRGRNDAHVARDGLDENRREPLAVLRDGCSDGVDVVVGQHDRVAATPDGNARGRRDPERHQARAGAREQRVDVAVVVAGELDQAVAARRGTRQPHGAHRRLGAGGDEAHHLDRRHGVDDLGGQVDLALGRGAERRSAGERIGDGGERLGIGVTEEERAPREHPVDVAVAVHVLDQRARPAAHEQRLVEPDGSHRAHRRVDPTRDQALRPVVEIGPRQSHRATSFAQ